MTGGTPLVDPAVSDKPSFIGLGYYKAYTPGNTPYMIGLIDEVRISNIARTSFDLTTAPSADASTVALWHFDESYGTTAIDSSGDNDGTIVGAKWNGPIWTTDAKFGGWAFRFDGVNDYVRVFGSPSLTGLTLETTVEAWLKFDDVRDAFYVRTPYDSGRAWGLDRWGGELRFHIYDGGAYKICSRAWTPTTNQWYHIAGTYDGTILRLYLDGNMFQESSYTGDIDSTDKGVVMGARYSYGGADFHRGLIDEVRIWSVALTADQIAASYGLGASGAQVKEETLPLAGTVIFTSAFYLGPDTVGTGPHSRRISIVPYDPSVTITSVALRTPQSYTPQGTTGFFFAGASTAWYVDVSVTSSTCKSIHLWLYLSTGERLGVNIQFLPYG